ncbi:hypothetical protein DOTSEDRAFT_81422 [Dothistroma septosporum NZE10]|uniref:Uncharacterized protein n=1 Tax=Dothistroma septosporum (strain NZE10 / CBS 128990) TaxID=675120 RepID=N1PME3_DOTSN|nr:hypothetical protein DOTSEDRAFT_81422 [Dothistroma septosporum NZE10]
MASSEVETVVDKRPGRIKHASTRWPEDNNTAGSLEQRQQQRGEAPHARFEEAIEKARTRVVLQRGTDGPEPTAEASRHAAPRCGCRAPPGPCICGRAQRSTPQDGRPQRAGSRIVTVPLSRDACSMSSSYSTYLSPFTEMTIFAEIVFCAHFSLGRRATLCLCSVTHTSERDLPWPITSPRYYLSGGASSSSPCVCVCVFVFVLVPCRVREECQSSSASEGEQPNLEVLKVAGALARGTTPLTSRLVVAIDRQGIVAASCMHPAPTCTNLKQPRYRGALLLFFHHCIAVPHAAVVPRLAVARCLVTSMRTLLACGESPITVIAQRYTAAGRVTNVKWQRRRDSDLHPGCDNLTWSPWSEKTKKAVLRSNAPRPLSRAQTLPDVSAEPLFQSCKLERPVGRVIFDDSAHDYCGDVGFDLTRQLACPHQHFGIRQSLRRGSPYEVYARGSHSPSEHSNFHARQTDSNAAPARHATCVHIDLLVLMRDAEALADQSGRCEAGLANTSHSHEQRRSQQPKLYDASSLIAIGRSSVVSWEPNTRMPWSSRDRMQDIAKLRQRLDSTLRCEKRGFKSV